MTLRELIKKIAERPTKLLGEATITRFHTFLFGWSFGTGIKIEDDEIWNGFQDRVAKEYGITSSHSWASIIRFYSRNDVNALDEALEMWKEYFKSLDNLK